MQQRRQGHSALRVEKGKLVKFDPNPKPPLIIPLASSLPGTNLAALTDVRLLALKQMEIEHEIAELQARLANAMQRLQRVAQEDLPLAFDAAQIQALTLPDGTEVIVKAIITANIKEENRPVAHAWLRANKLGALIKNTVKVAFGKGDDVKARKLIATLKKAKIPFERTEAVHPQTLGAFVRESLAAGKGLPASIEVHKVPTAKIIPPKD
jgi:hypothetical protein